MEETEDRGEGGGGGRPAKRPRREEEAGEEEQEAGEEEAARSGVKADAHSVPPSPVVHVRGLCDAAVEADLLEALGEFGRISYVMMMPFRRQALVEFDGVASAGRCVARGGVCVAEQPAFVNFSSSQRISRPNADDPLRTSKVLLLSVQNPLYPVTTDVLFSVFNPVANVLRIVVFKRSGVQAMVEFDSPLDAQKAKMALNGADIYTGCCTLKIETARPNKLNVVRNDSSSWDYTKPSPHRARGNGRQRAAILGERPSNGHGSLCPLLPLPANSRCRMCCEEVRDAVSSSSSFTTSSSSSSSFLGHGASSSVAMVSGLHPAKMNCDHIFNLFCLYGNVEKVKFMRTVPGTALVELGDGFAVDRSVTHLNTVQVFGQKLHVCVSRQQAVIPGQVFQLPDGSSSYRDFSLTRNNRFTGAGSGRNVIQPPAAVLHFFNAPPTLSRQQLAELCAEHDVPAFIKFKIFDGKPGSKTRSGLLEFHSKTEAVETLTVLNHHQIRIPDSSNRFTLKLCFSTSSHL